MSNEDITIEVIQNTQKTLGKYVKKPPLTEKLLKKPPFRFLHDIIKAVIVETMFLKGLFNDEELKSENFKDKESKIAFLTKLIEAVQTITNTKLKVRPSKIVAGLEPKETNILLQTIGKAIDKKLDSSKYINSLKQGAKKNEKKHKEKSDKLSKASTKDKKHKDKNKIETPKSTDRNKESLKNSKDKKETKNKEAKTTNKENVVTKEQTKEETKVEALDKLQNETKQQCDENSAIQSENQENESPKNNHTIENHEITKEEIKDEPKTESKRPISGNRPKSARPKSGDKGMVRPKSSLRPPSVRPSSARPGAPRLRPDSAIPMKETVNFGKINVIVENFDKEPDDEEETVIIQNTSPNLEEEPVLLDNNENKGHLVEQILEQIIEENKEEVLRFDVYNKEEINKEMAQLRNHIQNLTKSANPLGKLLNYLHEDIESMHSELEMWINIKNQLYKEIEVEKKIFEDLSKPLLEQLVGLDEKIKKQEQEITDIRGNIFKNDVKIRMLLLNK